MLKVTSQLTMRIANYKSSTSYEHNKLKYDRKKMLQSNTLKEIGDGKNLMSSKRN